MAKVGPRPTGSLFVQLLTLTGLTLVLSWAMSTLLLFMLPPPAPDFYRLAEIERTYRGAPITLDDYQAQGEAAVVRFASGSAWLSGASKEAIDLFGRANSPAEGLSGYGGRLH